MNRWTLLSVTLLTAGSTLDLEAQAPAGSALPAQATHIVVRYFNCPAQGEAVSRFQDGRCRR